MNPQHVKPFEVLEKVSNIAYRLALPAAMTGIHDVFHVSMLRKYIANPSHILKYLEFEIIFDLEHEVKPKKILAHSEKQLRNRTIPLVKVQWLLNLRSNLGTRRRDSREVPDFTLSLEAETFYIC